MKHTYCYLVDYLKPYDNHDVEVHSIEGLHNRAILKVNNIPCEVNIKTLITSLETILESNKRVTV